MAAETVKAERDLPGVLTHGHCEACSRPALGVTWCVLPCEMAARARHPACKLCNKLCAAADRHRARSARPPQLIARYYMKFTGMSGDEIEKATNRDTFMTPEDAQQVRSSCSRTVASQQCGCITALRLHLSRTTGVLHLGAGAACDCMRLQMHSTAEGGVRQPGGSLQWLNPPTPPSLPPDGPHR